MAKKKKNRKIKKPKRSILKKRKPKHKALKRRRFINKKRLRPTKKPIYALNTDFGSFYELRDLVLKSSPAEKDKMIEKINKLGRVKLAVISGIFINKDSVDPLIADLLIVGDDIESRKLRSFLKALEAEVGKEIKFAVMDKEEFQYRLAMFDRFVRVLIEGPHEKLINKLGL